MADSDNAYREHQEIYALHEEESWVRGVVNSSRDVTKRGKTFSVYNVKIHSDPVTLPTLSGASLTMSDVVEDNLHHVVGEGGHNVTDGETAAVAAADETFNDLLQMSYLHDSTLLNQVRKRYFQNLIYTHIGPILLALNPYDFKLKNYTADRMPEYIDEGPKIVRGETSELLPHAWSTAHFAYWSMREDNENQSVIVSGESGAGKTETAKIVTRYLGFVSTDGCNDAERADAELVTKKVNLTSPILEAFGNAKTRMNDNSSRFGKFMKVAFAADSGVMIGATMEVYLLEKSRIVTHGPEERAYHSFYQLLADGPKGSERADKKAELKSRLELTSAKEFPSLNVGKATVIPGVDDGADFDEVVDAMEAVGLTQEERSGVWDVVAGVVHALKLNFEKVAEDDSSKISDATSPIVDLLGRIWGISGESFAWELLNTTLKVPGQAEIKKKNAVGQATDFRDAICKTLYEALFLWLVGRINDLIAQPEGTSSQWIALLDIFGFENFKHGNSFEQLCINLANETLQNHYNSVVFTRDMEECAAEGIDTASVKFYDNQPCLDLIAGYNFALCSPENPGKVTSKVSLFSLLDEECKIQNGTDEQFLEKADNNSKRPGQMGMPSAPSTPVASPKSRPASPSPSTSPTSAGAAVTFDSGHPNFCKHKTKANIFQIMHYAGVVDYTVTNFRSKNLDSAKDELKALFRSSSTSFVAQLLPDDADEGGNSKGGRRGQTVSSYFKKQLISLMSSINSTHPHWIRCVKPHSAKKPRMFKGHEVMTQLRSAGVLETVRIRQQSFAVRLPFEQFARDYRILLVQNNFDRAGRTPKEACLALLDIVGINSVSRAQIGKTKVFLRTEAFYAATGARYTAKVKCASVVQDFARQRLRNWAIAARLRNEKVKLIQSFANVNLSEHIVRPLQLRAEEQRLLNEFRALLLLQSDEHNAREKTLLPEEDAAFNAIIAQHMEGLQALREAWEAAKREKDAADRAEIESEERAARQVIFEEWSHVLDMLHGECSLVADEVKGRAAILSEHDVVVEVEFSGAHERVRRQVAAIIRQRIQQEIIALQQQEVSDRMEGIEVEEFTEFDDLMSRAELQAAEIIHRLVLLRDEEDEFQQLVAVEAQSWDLVKAEWWALLEADHTMQRKAVRQAEMMERKAIAVEGLQGLMAALSVLERDRQIALQHQQHREAAEEHERQRVLAAIEEDRRIDAELDSIQERKRAQYLWALSVRQRQSEERAAAAHQAAIEADVARHAVNAETVHKLKVAEARASGRHVSAKAAVSPFFRQQRSASSNANPFGGTSVSPSRSSASRARSPNSTRLIASTPTRSTAGKAISLSPYSPGYSDALRQPVSASPAPREVIPAAEPAILAIESVPTSSQARDASQIRRSQLTAYEAQQDVVEAGGIPDASRRFSQRTGRAGPKMNPFSSSGASISRLGAMASEAHFRQSAQRLPTTTSVEVPLSTAERFDGPADFEEEEEAGLEYNPPAVADYGYNYQDDEDEEMLLGGHRGVEQPSPSQGGWSEIETSPTPTPTPKLALNSLARSPTSQRVGAQRSPSNGRSPSAASEKSMTRTATGRSQPPNYAAVPSQRGGFGYRGSSGSRSQSPNSAAAMADRRPATSRFGGGGGPALGGPSSFSKSDENPYSTAIPQRRADRLGDAHNTSGSESSFALNRQPSPSNNSSGGGGGGGFFNRSKMSNPFGKKPSSANPFDAGWAGPIKKPHDSPAPQHRTRADDLVADREDRQRFAHNAGEAAIDTYVRVEDGHAVQVDGVELPPDEHLLKDGLVDARLLEEERRLRARKSGGSHGPLVGEAASAYGARMQ